VLRCEFAAGQEIKPPAAVAARRAAEIGASVDEHAERLRPESRRDVFRNVTFDRTGEQIGRP
jgi:hypothetical protein